MNELLPNSDANMQEVVVRLPSYLTSAFIIEVGGFLTRHEMEVGINDVTVREPIPAAATITETIQGEPVVAFPYKREMTSFVYDKGSGTVIPSVTNSDLTKFAEANGFSKPLVARLMNCILTSSPYKRFPDGELVSEYVAKGVKVDSADTKLNEAVLAVKNFRQRGGQDYESAIKVAGIPRLLETISERSTPNLGKKSLDLFHKYCTELFDVPA